MSVRGLLASGGGDADLSSVVALHRPAGGPLTFTIPHPVHRGPARIHAARLLPASAGPGPRWATYRGPNK